jgi:catechol 2,3-dioxygenase-like lactoylglutathione lyase family enzyme
MTMKLNTIILSVGDVEMLDRCRDWYDALGFPRNPPDSPGESYWFDTGNGTQLGVHTGDDASGPKNMSLGFEVDDVDALYARLSAAGFVFEEPPTTKRWGGRTANLRDPAGTSISFVQYVKS